jgi:phage repressor protein C with HTH and peptisase S24 domain
MRVGERIKQARERAAMTQSDLARAVGVRPQSVQQWERGETDPRGKRMDAIAAALGVEKLWLLLGAEAPAAGPDVQEQYSLVQKVGVELSAGPGCEVELEEVEDHLAFRTHWLRSKGLQAPMLRAVYARGDSMAPRIQDGDILLVDTASRTIVDGAVYALRYDQHVRVKRLTWRFDGALIIRSDNPDPAYRDEIVPKEQLDAVNLLGRVVWVGGDV